MNTLNPFRAVFYNGSKKTARDDIAPPYDIVSEEEHYKLLQKSPNNIIRFTLGDTPGSPGKFEGLSEKLYGLVEEGVLKVDSDPKLFLYHVDYSLDGAVFSFLGVAGLVDLKESRILSHERTISKVKEGRLRALSGTRTNIGLILLSCDDEGDFLSLMEAGKGKKRFSAEVSPGETHEIYELADEVYSQLDGILAGKNLIIADGHHRFQTAQKYFQENPHDRGGRFCMVVLGSLNESSGLLLQPYHRTLKFSSSEEAVHWAEKVIKGFQPDATDSPDITLYYPGADQGVSLCYEGKDQSLISYLEDNFFPGPDDGVQVEYMRDLSDPHGRLQSGEPLVVMSLRAVTKKEFVDTVSSGQLFPPKSTYFYPKLYSGLIMRFLDLGFMQK